MAGDYLDFIDDPTAFYDGGLLTQAGGAPRMSPQEMVWERAARQARQRESNIASRSAPMTAASLPQNPFELAAWNVARSTPQNLGQALGANMAGSFMSYGRGLDQQFNSPFGPFGQLQQAAVDTAPSRAARDIAQINAQVSLDENRTKRELAERLIGNLFDGNFASGAMAPANGIRTDYGAGFSMPRRATPVNMARFRQPDPLSIFN